VTPVFVEVVGALTTSVNPARFATDTGTSALVDGFDAREVAVAAGTATMDPATARILARMLPATTLFGIGFLTHTSFSRDDPKPDRPSGDSVGCRWLGGGR
jgi:hypothetical protein